MGICNLILAQATDPGDSEGGPACAVCGMAFVGLYVIWRLLGLPIFRRREKDTRGFDVIEKQPADPDTRLGDTERE